MPRPHLSPTEKTKLINSFIFYIHLDKKTKAEKPIYERERERAALSQSRDEIEKKERELKYLDVPSGQGRRCVAS